MGARGLICGVGINDADYDISRVVNGVDVKCNFYKRWYYVLNRCYSEKVHARQPRYVGCSVSNDWLTFSNFKRWMEKQDWHGKQLDKDILIRGNKVYSEGACVFVSATVNSFVVGDDTDFSGATWCKRELKFRAQCRNPITGKNVQLGYFSCRHEAHLAWKKRKHEYACQLAGLQTDERVANALRTRYL